MEILTDLHCHTIASTHAYSTIYELVEFAKKKGLEAIAITDHGMELKDAPLDWHFLCLKRSIPKEYDGVRILKGCEANILDKTGRIDFPEDLLKCLDLVIASIHTPAYYSEEGGDHTSAYMGALNNPYVDILGHSGNPSYRYDIDKVIRKTKELGKLIEINGHSFDTRPKNIEICREIALKCKEVGTGIVVNSDCHSCFELGEITKAKMMLKDIDFPEELIMNRDLKTLREFLKNRKSI